MVSFRFDFMNTVNGKSSFFPNLFGSFLGNITQFRLSFAGKNLYLLQRIPFILFAPNTAHYFIGIAFNHVKSLLFLYMSL